MWGCCFSFSDPSLTRRGLGKGDTEEGESAGIGGVLSALRGGGTEGELFAELRGDVAFYAGEVQEILLDSRKEIGGGDGDAVRPHIAGASVGSDDGVLNGGVHLMRLGGGSGDAVSDGADHFLEGRFSNHSCESF